MRKSIPEIKENYKTFSLLLNEKKITQNQIIFFDKEKPSRIDTLYHRSLLQHLLLNKQVELIAEQKKNNYSSYKFQLLCSEFCPEPFFRFDSDGSAHRNKDLPLKEQMVTTPHFNSFDENGRPIAYKIGELEEVETKDLEQIDNFFKLFCKECNLRHQDDIFPNIIPGKIDELDLGIQDEDVLANIKFDI